MLPALDNDKLPVRGPSLLSETLDRLAEQLVSRGALIASDFEAGFEAAVRRGLGRWLDGLFGGLVHFEFAATVYDSIAAACGAEGESPQGHVEAAGAHAPGEAGASASVPPLAVALHATTRHCVCVRSGVEGLEARVPGLGWAVVDAIEVCGHPFGLFGFAWLHDAARDAYWGGCEDEIEFREMFDLDEDDTGGMTRALVEGVAPERPRRSARKLTQVALSALAAASDADVSRVCALLLASRRLARRRLPVDAWELDAEHDVQGTLEPAAVMCWDDVEGYERIGDDYYQRFMEGDCMLRSWVVLMALPLGSQAQLAPVERAWRRAIERLRCADELLKLVGRPA